MAKVMIHFSRSDFEVLASLVALEAFDSQTIFKDDPEKAEKAFKAWGELHGRLVSVVVNKNCEVKIDG